MWHFCFVYYLGKLQTELGKGGFLLLLFVSLTDTAFSMIMNPIDTAFAWLNSHPYLCVCFQSGGDPWVMQVIKNHI